MPKDNVPILSEEDIVTVKEIWNKSLVWKDQCMEAIYHRWMATCPSVQQTIYAFHETLREDIFFTIDLAVRALNMSTESTQPNPGCRYSTVEEYMSYYADIGIDSRQWTHLRKAFFFGLGCYSLYLNEEEIDDLIAAESDPVSSAVWRFFVLHIQNKAKKAIASRKEYFTSSLMRKHLPRHLSSVLSNGGMDKVGQVVCQVLLARSNTLRVCLASTSVDDLALAVGETLNNVVRGLEKGTGIGSLAMSFKPLAKICSEYTFPIETFSYLPEALLTALQKTGESVSTELLSGLTRLADLLVLHVKQPIVVREVLLMKAREWFLLLAKEQRWPEDQLTARISQVEAEIAATGTYTHTYEELQYGCRVAWRNSSKCIGRLHWDSLTVRDRRHICSPEEIFRVCVNHLDTAIARKSDKICSMTVFRPRRPNEVWGIRIWNNSLVSYACYEMPDGTYLGDPGNKHLTQMMIDKLGWNPPEPRTAWDILPLVVEVDGAPPRLYELPMKAQYDVQITHPANEKFNALALRCATLLSSSNRAMEIGGVEYNCCVFSRGFVEFEVARYLWEKLENQFEIAESFDLNTRDDISNWQEIGFALLSTAVSRSYIKSGVPITTHHTASSEFITHCNNEKKQGREVSGEWNWIGGFVGMQCPLWTREMRQLPLFPRFRSQSDIWAVKVTLESGKGEMLELDMPRGGVIVLYGSETGTCEVYAKHTVRKLRSLHPTLARLSEFGTRDKRLSLSTFSTILVITSSLDHKQCPYNAHGFLDGDGSLPDLNHTSFSVLLVGCSAFPIFCGYGHEVDKALLNAGGNRLFAAMKADELNNQYGAFEEWLARVSTSLLGSDEPIPRLECEVVPPNDHRVTELRNYDTDMNGVPAKLGRFTRCECVISNQLMLKSSETLSARVVAFDVSPLTDSYETGDRLCVLPLNSVNACENLASSLGLKLDDVVMGWDVIPSRQERVPASLFVPLPARVGDILRFHIDIRLTPDVCSKLISLLADKCLDETSINFFVLQEWIETLAEYADDKEKYNRLMNKIIDEHYTISAMLQRFSSTCSITIIDLLQIVRPLKPRYYSIASSALVHPYEAYICASLVSIPSAFSQKRYGHASAMLNDMAAGDSALVALSKSTFRLCANPQAPLLMIGGGIALAPMTAFCEERCQYIPEDDTVSPIGPALVFTGFLSTNSVMYGEELNLWLEEGALSEVHIALPPRSYIVDKMELAGENIVKLLSDSSCSVYVSGGNTTVECVFETLVSILVQHNNMTRLSAVRQLRSMIESGRYQVDCWGSTDYLRLSDIFSPHPTGTVDKVRRWDDSVGELSLTLSESPEITVREKNDDTIPRLPQSSISKSEFAGLEAKVRKYETQISKLTRESNKQQARVEELLLKEKRCPVDHSSFTLDVVPPSISGDYHEESLIDDAKPVANEALETPSSHVTSLVAQNIKETEISLPVVDRHGNDTPESVGPNEFTPSVVEPSDKISGEDYILSHVATESSVVLDESKRSTVGRRGGFVKQQSEKFERKKLSTSGVHPVADASSSQMHTNLPQGDNRRVSAPSSLNKRSEFIKSRSARFERSGSGHGELPEVSISLQRVSMAPVTSSVPVNGVPLNGAKRASRSNVGEEQSKLEHAAERNDNARTIGDKDRRQSAPIPSSSGMAEQRFGFVRSRSAYFERDTSSATDKPASVGSESISHGSVDRRSLLVKSRSANFEKARATDALTATVSYSNCYSYDALRDNLVQNIDMGKKESYLSDAEFLRVMGVTKLEFAALPKWKQLTKKREVGLF